MNFDLISRKDQDIGRGTALLVSGAVFVLLKWILPDIAWLAIAAYGVYRLFRKEVGEGVVALALAVLFFLIRGFLGWLLWIAGALIVGFGIFFLLRAFRTNTLLE